MKTTDDILQRKYDVKKRFVEVNDAQFILELRLDEKLGRFLSYTDDDISLQEDWINNYKKREKNGLEFYFIYVNSTGKPFGLSRIYNINDNSFEVGSWLFSKDSPEGLSVLGDLCARDFAFNKNKEFTFCRFEVRKDNRSVVNYHKRFNPTLVGEDELNYYFELSREKYELFRDRILKIYDNGNK